MNESDVLRSTILFVFAAVSEIGGAYLSWQALRAGLGVWLVALGGVLLAFETGSAGRAFGEFATSGDDFGKRADLRQVAGTFNPLR